MCLGSTGCISKKKEKKVIPRFTLKNKFKRFVKVITKEQFMIIVPTPVAFVKSMFTDDTPSQ